MKYSLKKNRQKINHQKNNRWQWQWQRFKNEDKEIFLDWLYPSKLEDFKNKLVLDAGCGNAGYTKIVAQYAKKIVALDKYCGQAAQKNSKSFKNIKVVKGDVENFKYKEKFDAIYSVGVLHHLKNPEKGFKNLLNNLKTGGFINIWVYAKEGNEFMVKIVEPLKRLFLLKLPENILKILAHILTLTLYTFAWSIYFLPLSLPYREYLKKFRRHSYERNIMNIFDKLNAPLTWWISEKEIRSWFKDLSQVKIKHYNNISWRGFGIKK